ncbi:MAG: DUF2177 family protein [Betaproteobacteria bacterium]
MTRLLLAYAGALVVFCALDYLWLGHVAKAFYQAQVGPLLLARPNWGAAALLYIAYPAAIVFFATLPSLATASVAHALWTGALLGLVVYGTYELTNLATLKGWTLGVAIVDALWGAVVTAAAAGGGHLLARLAGPAG